MIVTLQQRQKGMKRDITQPQSTNLYILTTDIKTNFSGFQLINKTTHRPVISN